MRLFRSPRARRTALASACAAVLLAAALLLWPRQRVWMGEEEVPPAVRTRKAWSVAKGWEIILRAGRPGARRVTRRETLRGLRVVGTEEVSSTVLSQPVAEVRLVGATGRPNAVNAPRLTRVVRSLETVATGYDAGPESNSFEHAGRTKLGWRTRRGIVAVDPSVIPLRSLLYIEGYGLAWAGDIGGAIKGKRVDLCFNSTEEALKWGRRKAWVYILQGVRK